MRKIIGFVGIVAMAVGFPVAIVALVAASQLDSITGAAKLEPQAMRLSELAKNGPGDNVHVELSDFNFGKPVIQEAKDGKWAAVWVPLYTGRPTKGQNPPAFLHTALIHDQAALDALLKQKSVRGLAGSAMGDTRWSVAPAVILYNDFPKLDPTKMMVVTDASYVIDGKVWLPSEQLLDPATTNLCWFVAAGAGVAGFFGLIGWMLTRQKPATSSGPARRRVDLLDAARLEDHTPVSTHEYDPMGGLKRAAIFGVGMVITGAFGFFCAAFAANELKKGKTGVGVAGLLFGGFMLVLAVVAAWVMIQELFFPISKVAAYRGGIRWQRRGRIYTALWSDITAVYRQTTEIYVNGQHKGTCKILSVEVCNGKYLYFDGELLTNYDEFADYVQSTHGGYIMGVKSREQHESGEANFGKIGVRVDGVNVNGTFIPWARLERFEIANGHLCFYSSEFSWNKCRTFALKEVPNYAVLLDMLRSHAMCY